MSLRAIAAHALGRVLTNKADPGKAVVTDGVIEVVLIVRVHEPDATPNLSPVEKALFEASTATPQTRKQLARRAGYRYNTHTSQAAKRLIELGLLKSQEGGYVRA